MELRDQYKGENLTDQVVFLQPGSRLILDQYKHTATTKHK